MQNGNRIDSMIPEDATNGYPDQYINPHRHHIVRIRKQSQPHIEAYES